MKHLFYTICILFLVSSAKGQSEEMEVVGDIKATSLAGTGVRLNVAFPSGKIGVIGVGTANQVLMTNGVTPFWGTIQTPTQNEWSLSGNTGTNQAFNFIGTRDFEDVIFKTDNVHRMGISKGGTFYVGNFAHSSQAAMNINIDNTDYDIGLSLRHDPQTSSGLGIGINNSMQTASGGSGLKITMSNSIRGAGDGEVSGVRNTIDMTGSGLKTGVDNRIYDASGGQVGMINRLAFSIGSPGSEPGSRTAVSNSISSTNADSKTGVKNFITETNGEAYGVENILWDSPTNSKSIYGTHNSVIGNGSAKVYAGYFDATLALDGSSTGTAYAAVFNRGHVVMNEIGRDSDLRVETENNEYALLVDADKDLIRVGSTTGGLPGNGQVLNGITQQYVADFDLGLGFNTGTTIGIGSNEYIVDGNYEIILNGNFSPINHMINDLGFSATQRAWDNIYGDEFINVSDRREKNSINSLDYGLNEILKLDPVAYKLNSDPYQETKLGLIAQEVLSVIPEAVKTHAYKTLNENDKAPTKVEMDRMGMNYQYLIPVIINATKEQQELIEIQNQLIQELRKEIDELKNDYKSNG